MMKEADSPEKSLEDEESSKPSLMRLLKLAMPEMAMLIISFIFVLGSEAANMVTPLIVANAYDALINPTIPDNAQRMSEINHWMMIAVIVTIVGILAGFLRATIQGVIGERVVARLRCKLYEQILRQEIAFFDEHKSGELVSRLGSDTTLLQTVVSTSLPEVLTQLVKAVAGLFLMFYISPKLAGLALGGVSIIFVICLPTGQLMGSLSKAYQDVLGSAQNHSTEAIGSMRTVQAFAAERKEILRYAGKIGDPDNIPLWWPPKDPTTTYRVGFFKAIVNAGFFSFVFGAGFGFLNVTLWYGFYLVLEGEVSLGQLTAFNSYIISIGFAMGQCAQSIAKVYEGLGAGGRVFYLLDRVPLIPEPPSSPEERKEAVKPDAMVGDIVFENVSFSYPSRPGQLVLDGVSLTIPSNTTTALVGSSGAGKSTVVSLLQRFYDINQGRITVDGHDLKSLDLTWLRQHVGYVQQEPHLFGLTIRENMLYGVERDVSQEELEAAAIDAHAHDFIKEMTDGYETMVGERGVQLSGGQRQRVAIARALLTNCRILLLDEATSALDAESEHLVQRAIEKAVVGRTVIIVAHRLSTIRQADQIVVMDNHRVVDVGVHDALMTKCSKYHDLIKRQSVMIRDISKNGLDKMLADADEDDEEN
jgi:ATP-binding cassette subfamily B protein